MRHALCFGITLFILSGAPVLAQETVWTYKAASGHLDGSPAISDLDGDGANEVVVAATSGEVTALDGNGRVLWSKMVEPPISITPTTVNVVGEPTPEVLVLNNHGVLYCLDGTSGAEVWRQQLGAGVEWGMTSIVAADLGQDGQIEIVTGDERGTVVCYSGDGQLVWRYEGQQGSTMCPAVGDLGFGPEMEVVVSGKTGSVVCLSHEGKALWACEGAGPASSPVIADIVGDAANEVVVVQGANLVALDTTGAALWSMPMKREVDSALTCADMDGDGKAEIFAVDIAAHMVCVAGDGAAKWTANVEERVRRSPSVADVDGDGALEVLVAGYSGAMHVFSQDGYLKQRAALSGASNGAATIADLAGDGTPTVLCTSANLLAALRWAEAKPGAASVWPEYRFDAARSGCPGGEAGEAQVRIEDFDEGDCYIGTNEFRVAVDNPGISDASVELTVLLNERPLAHEAFPCVPGKQRCEIAYVLDGRQTANLQFAAKVVSGGKTLAARNRALFVAPFRQELADLEDLFGSIESHCSKLAGARGLEERAHFLHAHLPQLAKRVDNAGTLPDAERRALRDELAGLLGEMRRIEGLVKHAVALTADGRTLAAGRANPWAPFGGVDEILEGRVQEPSLEVEAFHGEHEVAALNVFNLGGEGVYARVEVAPFKREGGDENTSVPARGVVRLHEAIPVATQVLNLSADAVPALNQGNVLVMPAWDGRQLWIDVDTTPLAPGTWISEVKLRTLAVNPSEVTAPIKVTVWDAALPEKQALSLCHWGYVHSSILKDQPDAALHDQLDLGTNVFVGLFYPKATFDADGVIVGEIDFAQHDEYVRRHAPHGVILFCGYQGALSGPAKPGEPAYNKAHVAWLRAWVKHLAELGVGYDGFALYPVDEPGLTKGLVEAYLQMAQLAREADPQIRMYTDPVGRITMEELERMKPFVDIWCPNRIGLLLRDGADKRDFILSTGATVWTYECDSNAKHQSPLGYYRGQAWLAWHYGITGIGFWSYCTAPDDPWFSPQSGVEYLLIYQGEGVVRSKRWFAIRDGIEDYSMLAALRERVAAAGSEHADAAAKAKELLGERASAIGAFCGLDEDGTTPGRHGLAGARGLADTQWEAFKAIRREMAELMGPLAAK